MDIRHLRYFIAIVEAGSFSRAAGVLRVAQPALSQHVLAMEGELGVILLHRTARGVKPTAEGLRLLSEARSIHAQFAALQDHVRGREARPSGEVRFGMPGTVSEQLGVPLIEGARDAYPEISIRITEAMSGFVLDWLREGVVDIALLFDVADTKGFTRHQALAEEISLFGTPDMPGAPTGTSIALGDALRLPLVVPSPPHALRALLNAAALSIGSVVDPTIEIDSYRQIKRLVARGLAFGMLPMVAIEEELGSGGFRAWQLKRPPVIRRIFLAYRTDRPLSAAARAVGMLSWTILKDMVTSGAWRAEWSRRDDIDLN